MKTALELAMERFGAADTPALSAEQKAELAEIDSRFQAKIAEKEVFLQGQINQARTAGDATALEQLETQLRREKSRLEEERESAKERVRRS